MLSTNLSVDIGAARRLIREQFPQFGGERVEALATAGTDNAIFRVGASATARFPLRPGDPAAKAEALRREAAAMTELAVHCTVPTPRTIGLGEPGAGYPMPWMMQSWIVGDVATPDGLSASPAFARDLACLIEGFRRAATRGRSFDGSGRGGRLSDHDDWMETCFDNSEGLLDVARLRRLWAGFRELPPPDTLAMNHKDLIPPNLLVRGERLVGVLDGGGFAPTDPALDLVAAWHLLDRSRREELRRRLVPDAAEWRRGAAWAFQQAMGLVWYYERANPVMSALGRSTLARIVEDPDL